MPPCDGTGTTQRLWDAPDPGYTLLGGQEWVPAHEFVESLDGKPDDYVVKAAGGLWEWTAGEIRQLAAKGQAIAIPRVLPHIGIWEIGS